ncbi:MAG TPA: cytochrome c [Bryobacteraceae bacterium]|nr:cytochrome c [Bryobacteraceae bacterium]
MKKVAILSLPFLALSLLAQDLPEGKGKKETTEICTTCHGLDNIVAKHATKEEWAAVVDSMVERGATGSKEQLETIVEYLAANFGPEKPPAQQ